MFKTKFREWRRQRLYNKVFDLVEYSHYDDIKELSKYSRIWGLIYNLERTILPKRKVRRIDRLLKSKLVDKNFIDNFLLAACDIYNKDLVKKALDMGANILGPMNNNYPFVIILMKHYHLADLELMVQEFERISPLYHHVYNHMLTNRNINYGDNKPYIGYDGAWLFNVEEMKVTITEINKFITENIDDMRNIPEGTLTYFSLIFK